MGPGTTKLSEPWSASFVLPGRPKTFKSLRVRHGRNVYAIHSKDKKKAQACLQNQKPDIPVIVDQAVNVSASFHFKRPKSHFKKSGLLKPTAPKHILKRPDIDNCIKFLLDALQPEVIIDDKLVVEIKVTKKWCNTKDEEATRVELKTVD